MEAQQRRERIAGSLYGLCVGDALGLPVEMMSAAEIRARYGVLDRMVGARGRRPGVHSDDAQQAFTLCDALLEDPVHPSIPLARSWVAMADALGARPGLFGLHRWTGKNFRDTVKALRAGTAPHQASTSSAGNGVAMMIAPVAYWASTPEELHRLVLAVGRVKQRDPRGLGAAAAVAFVSFHAIAEGSLASLSGDALLSFVRAVEDESRAGAAEAQHLHAFSRALDAMLVARAGARQSVLDGIAAEASRGLPRPCGPGAGYALASVITALYLALVSPDFASGVRDAINLGEDADSTGAICGAILGACVGYAGIPAAWREALAANGLLEDRIDALAARARGFRPAHALLDLEREWTILAWS